MRTSIAAVVAALAVFPVPALTAQGPGTVEIGGFGRFTRFDKSLQLDDAFGGGGWLGIFVAPGLALEGTGVYMPTTGPFISDGTLVPLHARLVYQRTVGGPAVLLVGAGYVHNVYGRTGNVSDDGVSGLIGLRLDFGPAVAFRIEAIEDFIPVPSNQSASVVNNWNFAAQAGLVALLGRPRPKDRDHDRVVDTIDACPGTPPGELVDQRGCSIPKDADGDGVVDAYDKCANTPSGDKVDAGGCPLPTDADGDHVADAKDRCPNTAPGEAVDLTGCPPDSDHDGIVDSADKCPGSSAGDKVDVTGCTAPKDSDSDGVMDTADKCPGTITGERVDAIGCPALFTGTQRTLVLDAVIFEVGSPALTAQSRSVLDRISLALASHPGMRVEVAGYTDNRGSAAANLRLSQARADAVRGYLIERGVAPEQVTARGFGAEDPISTNATALGRSRNRRVELHRLN